VLLFKENKLQIQCNFNENNKGRKLQKAKSLLHKTYPGEKEVYIGKKMPLF